MAKTVGGPQRVASQK